MNDTYSGESELRELNKQWSEAMSNRDYQLADNIQRMMDRLSERAIQLADIKLKESLRRSDLI